MKGYKMNKNTIGILVALVLAGLGSISCGSEKAGPGVEPDPLAIHDKVLTVDTHSDTPMFMIRDWDMGVRHEPGRRSGKIDRPRMKEGKKLQTTGNVQGVARTPLFGEMFDTLHHGSGSPWSLRGG